MKEVTGGYVIENGKWCETKEEAQRAEIGHELFEEAYKSPIASPARVINYVLDNFDLIRKTK